jgi:hypothetical protein
VITGQCSDTKYTLVFFSLAKEVVVMAWKSMLSSLLFLGVIMVAVAFMPGRTGRPRMASPQEMV